MVSPAASADDQSTLPLAERIIPMVVATSLFLENLDSTVVSTALPSIARSLGESPVHLSLAITSYLLSVSICLPASGWLADRFGGRTVFAAAVSVFLIGSIGCAFSGSILAFVLARLLQGAGGAMMVPVSRLILLRTVPKRDLVRAMAWFSMPALVGPVIGPPIGGFFTTYMSWPWIFWINVPIGLIGIVLVAKLVPPMPAMDRRSFDGIGFLLSGLALTGVIAALETAGRDLIPWSATMALGALGVIASLLYAQHAKHAHSPLINLRLFNFQTFRASILGGFAFRVGIGSTPFLLPLMFQESFGMSAFKAGLLSCTAAGGAFFMKTAVRLVLRKFGFRKVLTGSGLLTAVSLAVMGLFTDHSTAWMIVAVLFAGGVFRSLQFTALNTLAVVEISDIEMSNATTIIQMGQQVSRSFGVGFGALGLWLVAGGVTPTGHIDSGLFVPVFAAFGALSAVSILAFQGLASDVGSEVSGQRLATSPKAS